MTALDYCLYDNRTPSVRSGEDWDLKAATGALGRREDLRRAFRAYCKLSHGDDGHPEGYDAAVGGWRQPSVAGYLLCVTLETPDRRNRHSLAVIGLWCPDRDTLGALIDAGDPIETARPILTMARLPARLEIRGRAGRRGRGLKTPEKTAYVRFRRGESVPLALSLLDGAAFGALPSILGITATSKLTDASKQGFRIVFSAPAPTDERAQAALARLESAPTSFVERELPAIVLPYPAAASPRIGGRESREIRERHEIREIGEIREADADVGLDVNAGAGAGARTDAYGRAHARANAEADAHADTDDGREPLDAVALRPRSPLQLPLQSQRQSERQESSTRNTGFPDIPMVPIAPPRDSLRDSPPGAQTPTPTPLLAPAPRSMPARVAMFGVAAGGCLLLAGGIYIAGPRIMPVTWRMRAVLPTASSPASTNTTTSTPRSAEPSASKTRGALSSAATPAATSRAQAQDQDRDQDQSQAQARADAADDAHADPGIAAAPERDTPTSASPIESLRDRLRALTALDPVRLRESPGFVAAEQVDVVKAHAADRARVQHAYAALIDLRRQLLQPDWLKSVEYYVTGVGAGAPRDERERRLTQLLGTTAAGPRACDILREAFGAELASATSTESAWCRALTRVHDATTALDRPAPAERR